MNRRQWIMLSAAAATPAAAQNRTGTPDASATPERLLLKDYRPRSIFKIPVTEVNKAKFPAIDAHSHGTRPPAEPGPMVKLMDAANIEKAIILTGASTPERFAEVRQPYAKYPGRFDLWCGFDMAGYDQPGFEQKSVKALEECHRLGATGVGELSDKGRGFRTGPRPPQGTRPSFGPHMDDPRVDPLFDCCARLAMPVNIHVSDPIWGYGAMDNTNDGLMNGYTWRIQMEPGVLGHDELIASLEASVKKHPRTMFVACHLANLEYDLTRLGGMLDRHPNLYADMSARFGEMAAIPRAVARFLQKYPDRVLYGTDMGYTPRMLGLTFRILETEDEHFYARELFDYHWPLHGFGLPDAVLKKLYRDNAVEVYRRAREAARYTG